MPQRKKIELQIERQKNEPHIRRRIFVFLSFLNHPNIWFKREKSTHPKQAELRLLVCRTRLWRCPSRRRCSRLWHRASRSLRPSPMRNGATRPASPSVWPASRNSVAKVSCRFSPSTPGAITQVMVGALGGGCWDWGCYCSSMNFNNARYIFRKGYLLSGHCSFCADEKKVKQNAKLKITLTV